MKIVEFVARWLEKRRTACQVDEEWTGYFIGRRYCHRHHERWDTGGPCPRAANPTAKVKVRYAP